MASHQITAHTFRTSQTERRESFYFQKEMHQVPLVPLPNV